MRSLEKVLAVLTVTARLSSCQDSGYNLSSSIEAESSSSLEVPGDDCEEDEWSCHEKGESLAANNNMRGKIVIILPTLYYSF